MYEPGMTDLELQELAAAGLTPDDVAPDPVEIWPETLPVYHLFSSICTQWRVGASGATGLDYNVLYHKMDRMKLSSEEFDLLESDIQIMECAALKAMRAKSET